MLVFYENNFICQSKTKYLVRRVALHFCKSLWCLAWIWTAQSASTFYPLWSDVLAEVYEEDLASHRYEVGKREDRDHSFRTAAYVLRRGEVAGGSWARNWQDQTWRRLTEKKYVVGYLFLKSECSSLSLFFQSFL